MKKKHVKSLSLKKLVVSKLDSSNNVLGGRKTNGRKCPRTNEVDINTNPLC